ncbi:Gm16181 [Phodopus roborovskii]|uniref:Gm16181 protein n=1 Tax=Phodopus roborovskii TaxID=109678 RepID=A0AAV0A3C3_PHORO|nr:Gm16181 [Phodopus roborovskii]
MLADNTCRNMGWRDGSEVKSTDCSSRGPEFNSQQPHGGSQPSVMRSGALFWLQVYMQTE